MAGASREAPEARNENNYLGRCDVDLGPVPLVDAHHRFQAEPPLEGVLTGAEARVV